MRKKEEEDVGSFIYQTCRVHVYSLPFNYLKASLKKKKNNVLVFKFYTY